MQKQQISLMLWWLVPSIVVFFILYYTNITFGPEISGTSTENIALYTKLTGSILTAIVVTFIHQEIQPEKKKPAASNWFFIFSVFLCILYWLVILIAVLRWKPDTNMSLNGWLNSLLPYMLFYQAVLFLAMSFFFVKTKPDVPLAL